MCPSRECGAGEGMQEMIIASILLICFMSQSPATPEGEFDPGLKLSGLVADSLLSSAEGRFGIMGLNLTDRTSFVKSEGGFFVCDGFPLMPVACAVCHRALPLGFMMGFAPDSLITAAWQGNGEAAQVLADRIGRERIEAWLAACDILGTTLTDTDGSCISYVSTPWDCMMMLAWMDRMLPASGIEGLGAPTLDMMGIDCTEACTGALGLAHWDGESVRAVFSARMDGGRYLGITMLADSMPSRDEAVYSFGELVERLVIGDSPCPGM